MKRVAPVTGRDLRNARSTLDENNLPAIGFSMNREGAIKFGKLTGDNVNKLLAVILDNRIETVATIQERINDEGRIHGNFTTEEAAEKALILRSGALPAGLTYLEERTIGPSLGADSIRAGVLASVGGLAFVALFMLAYYRLAGINAILSVVMNLVILLGFMAYVEAAMTLPGIAGFILTIGMGVDSNVLIFERIKEELAAGKGARAAVARRLRPRVPDDSRYPRRVADLGRVPLPVRHRADSRLRDHAVLRPAGQRVHGGLRVAHALRADSGAQAGDGDRDPECVSLDH